MKKLLLFLALAAAGLQGWADDNSKYPDVLYVAGDATSAGWFDGEDDPTKLYKKSEKLYEGFVRFTGTQDGELKFMCQKSWHNMWGAKTAGTSVSAAGTYELEYDAAGNGTGHDKKFKPTITGLYLVIVDLNNEEVTFKQWNKDTDVYEIGTAVQLKAFADCINQSNINSNCNLYVKAKLTKDIDYTASDYQGQSAMIGQPNHAYKGTFDGQNHIVTIAFNNTSAEETGLFRRMNGGTIKNLKVAGTISTNQNYAGGICSGIWQGGYIQNCESAVTITDSRTAEAKHGGILAKVQDLTSGRNVYVQNCLFSGTFTAENCTGCAGIVGQTTDDDTQKAWVHIKNNLVTGTLGFNDDATNDVIVCNKGDLDNNYYTGTIGSNIGKTKATDASSFKLTGELCHKLNGNTNDGTNWTQTIGSDDNPVPFNTRQTVHQASTNSFTNLSIDEGIVQISSASDLDKFASEVNAGNTAMNAKLTADIEANGTFTPIGTTDKKYFGTFNGNSKSVTLAIDTRTNDNVGLFSVVQGGVNISNVITKGFVNGKSYVAGIVGRVDGTGRVTISNCGNEATITTYAGANGAGIVGVNMNSAASITIQNCYNKGDIIGNPENGTADPNNVGTASSGQNGAISGWIGDLNSGGKTCYVTNCYNIGEVKTWDNSQKKYVSYQNFVRRNLGTLGAEATNLTNNYNIKTGVSSNINSESDGQTNGTYYGKLLTEKQVTSGELCYKLCNGTSTTDVWKQKIGGTKGYPNFEDTDVVNEVVADESYTNFSTTDINSTTHAVKIGTPANLTQFSKEVNAGNTSMNAELTDDITAESGFAPIGNSSNMYAGDFDGKEKTVTLAINNTTTDNQGLFGMATGGANIHDLIVAGSVKGNRYVAGVIGKAQTGHVQLQNIINTATITGNSSADYPDAAGLVGCVESSTYITMTNCGNTGAVSGKTNHCAALCGWANQKDDSHKSSFTNCWNIGTISGVNETSNLFRNSSKSNTPSNCYDASATASRGQGTLLNSGAAASGELAFMINATKSSGSDWYQTLGTDSYPFPFSSHGELPSLTPVDGWYEISEPWQLCWMAVNVNEKNGTYKNANIKLKNDIDYTDYTDQAAMFGKPSNTFQGIFDGQCNAVTVAFNNTNANETALFRKVSGGTIKNLKVSGTITTDKQFAGGICSLISGGGTIQYCESNVTINDTKSIADNVSISDNSRDATHGGILAYINSTSSGAKVHSCLFSGTINAPKRIGCAGIVGWSDENATNEVKNCLVKGDLNLNTSSGNNNEVIVRTKSGSSNATTSHNYYTCTITGINTSTSPTDASSYNNGKLCYLLNENTVAGKGWYQDLAPGTTTDAHPVPFSTHKKVYKYSDELYTNLEVSGGKIQIGGATDLTNFSALVNEGNYNLNAELTNDIDMTDKSWTPIGKFEKSDENDKDDKNDGSKAYHGTFDGKNFTIDNLAQSSDNTDNNQGLFGVVRDGCTIQNLILGSGCQFYGNNYVGAFVGSARGSKDGLVTIQNCGNEATVGSPTTEANRPTNHAAAFIGVVVNDDSPKVHIYNCYNKGNIYGKSGSNSAILTGWFGSNSDVEVKNFYNIGTVTNPQDDDHPLYRRGSNLSSSAFDNVYHTSSVQGATEIEDGWLTSGELCYRLNGSEDNGTDWYQDLSEEGYPIPFGTKTVAAGKWFNSSDNDVYYNKEGDDYTVYQLNMSDTQTEYNVPDDGTVTAKNVSVDRSITAGKWVGLCLPFDYAIPSGWDVRELTNVNGTGDEACMIFTAASSIEASKPYLVKTSADVPTITATDKTIVAEAHTIDRFEVNMVGRFKKASINVGDYYITNNSELKKLKDSSVDMKGFRAYFTLDDDSPVKALSFDIEDDADGISPLLTSPEEEGRVYNLAGQRLNKVQKGINIVNGRKVLF